MASTQEILQAIGNMQVNAQEALPVIPNNGNPGGAYNMPVSIEPQQPVAPPPDPYAWLQPSQAAQTTSQLLQDMANRLKREMYNKELSQGNSRNTINPDGTLSAQMLTDKGSEFVPYSVDQLLPVVPIDPYAGLEQNRVPPLPRTIP